MPPVSGPCSPWIDADDIDLGACEDQDKRTAAASYASAILFRLSGRQFPGICSRVVRPCNGNGCVSGGAWPLSWAFPSWEAGGSLPTVPMRIGGEWYNIGGTGCGGHCNLSALTLPGPVNAVTEIVIDGVVLPSSAYRIEGHRQLIRVDGRGWPCSNDFSRPSAAGTGAPGTWQVNYSFGRLPGPDGLLATTQFATEIAKFLCGSECNLPARIRSIVREGTTIDIADPLTFIGEGKVGIAEVDLWLVSVNPAKLQRRSTIRRLDRPRRDGLST